jgi:hypothetical protein
MKKKKSIDEMERDFIKDYTHEHAMGNKNNLKFGPVYRKLE